MCVCGVGGVTLSADTVKLILQVTRQVSKEVYSFYGGGHSMTVGEDNELHLEQQSFFRVPIHKIIMI